jgi:arylsulfatase A-like enzyme
MPSPRRLALLAALAAIAFAASAFLACSKAPPRRLNLVLVVIDTLRADRMALYGHSVPNTPAIDAWSKGGTVWDTCYSPAPWTVPAMSMLMSGRQVMRRVAFPDAERVPLAEHLEKHGYRCGAVVANALLRAENGWSRGFESFEQNEAGRTKTFDDGWPGEQVVGRGLKWLDGVRASPRVDAAGDEQPFFLYLHLLDPHHPYKAWAPPGGTSFQPSASNERRERFLSILPENQRVLLTDEAYRGIEQRIAAYDSEVLEADAALAQLFAYLDENGLAGDTLVVVTSDHGECLWDRRTPKTNRSHGLAHFQQLFSGHGEVVYEELLRVPLVLRGPGVPAGVRAAQHASLLDIVPTVLSLLDLPAMHRLDGRVLDPRAADVPHERVAYFTHTCSLTEDGRYKLHLGKGRLNGKELFPPELYDLAADPAERAPIDDPARIAAMTARLEQWMVEKDDKAVPLTDQDRAAMQALGYLGKDEKGDGMGAEEPAEVGDEAPDEGDR